jgi:protein involved in polysaccharide export with SLBB domain
VRDALENRVKDETLALAFPKESMPFLGLSPDKEEKVLAEQLELITGDDNSSFIVMPGDDLVISFTDRDMTNAAIYRVNDEGLIFMPLVGRVHVKGAKVCEIRELLDKGLAAYINEPNVMVRLNVRGKVMVVGAVGRPGIYTVVPDMTVMEAILTAGSYKDEFDEAETARLKSVMLMRGPVDKPEVTRLNLKQMIQHGNRRDNVLVKPGDMIYVPRSYISNIDRFLGRMYRYVVIWYGLGGQDIIEEGDPLMGPFNGEVN